MFFLTFLKCKNIIRRAITAVLSNSCTTSDILADPKM